MFGRDVIRQSLSLLHFFNFLFFRQPSLYSFACTQFVYGVAGRDPKRAPTYWEFSRTEFWKY